MNLPSMPSARTIVLLLALSLACVAVAGCGNKGPLVKPSANPAATPADAEPAAAPAATPATTPASEPAAGTPAARR